MHRHGLQGRLESVRKIQRPPPGLVRQKMAQQRSQCRLPLWSREKDDVCPHDLPVFTVATFIIIQGSWKDRWLCHLLLLLQGAGFGTH